MYSPAGLAEIAESTLSGRRPRRASAMLIVTIAALVERKHADYRNEER